MAPKAPSRRCERLCAYHSTNDERLRALEAYILAQRKTVALEYGKH